MSRRSALILNIALLSTVLASCGDSVERDNPEFLNSVNPKFVAQSSQQSIADLGRTVCMNLESEDPDPEAMRDAIDDQVVKWLDLGDSIEDFLIYDNGDEPRKELEAQSEKFIGDSVSTFCPEMEVPSSTEMGYFDPDDIMDEQEQKSYNLEMAANGILRGVNSSVDDPFFEMKRIGFAMCEEAREGASVKALKHRYQLQLPDMGLDGSKPEEVAAFQNFLSINQLFICPDVNFQN